ncbi:MAG: saccharopine dehydrogenase [Chloroflexi bacterium]|nr:saccharopine dehydrogenase [Chloroflexota bacterium]
MKIVVLGGCGDMGSYVVRDLVAHSDAAVVIADYRLPQAQKLAAELGGRTSAAFVDANKENSLLSVLQSADAAVGCIGPFYHFAPKMASAAIQAGVNYVDICDDYGPMPALFALDEAAQQAGITAITGLGWTPGMTNVCARRGADRLDAVDEINVSWAGGAADSEGLAVIMHVLYAITGKVPTYMNGQWQDIDALSGKEVVEFPQPLGKVEVFHCGHPEPLTIPRYIKANTVTLKGALTPKWNDDFAAFLVRLGLGSTPGRIAFTAKAVHTIEGVFRTGGVPASAMRVDVKGTKGGVRKHYAFAAADKMGRLTGIPAAIGAVLLAQGQIAPKGVFAPEGCLDPQLLIDELARRNIQVYEQEISP